MRKKPSPLSNPLSAEEATLMARLRKRPELKERLEAVLRICAAEEGELRSADEIEALLIEEMRKLGLTSMQQWAKAAEARVGAQYQEQHPGSYCGKKKR